MSEKSAGCATRGSSGGTGHIKSTAVLRESLPVALDLQNSPPVPRKLLPVARGRIFGDGCANRSCYAVTGFRANRRERTSGPDEGGDAAKQKDGVCPTTPANEADKPALSRRQPEGLWWQGRRSAATRHKA